MTNEEGAEIEGVAGDGAAEITASAVLLLVASREHLTARVAP